MKLKYTTLTILLCYNIAYSQTADLDLSFDPGSGVNSDLRTISVQTDGKIILTGNFSSYNGTARNKIVRLNEDASIDTSFDPGSGADFDVQTHSIQTDGKIIIGGWLTSYNGTPRNKIARVNADGSLDASFDPGTGLLGEFLYGVYATAVQSDGKIIIGGDFTSYNGTPINNIARLNTDGSLDATFDPGLGADGPVRTISLQSDGKIIIGGYFSYFNDVYRRRIARLNADGSVDVSFDPGSGANDYVFTTSIQSDGKIIVGGYFTLINGVSRNHLTRMNPDGSIDLSFDSGSEANDYVFTTAIQSDGKIIIGGDFTAYDGTERNRVARINIDGSVDTSFDPGAGANNSLKAIAIQSDGKIIIGGYFNSYDGTERSRIARLSGGTVGIQEFGNHSKNVNTVYPNPTTGIVYINDNLLVNKNVIVYSLDGKVVGEFPVQNGAIDLSSLNKGLYLVELIKNETSIRARILVQ